MGKPVVVQFLSCIRDGGAETLVKDYALLMKKCKVVIVTIFPIENNSANERILRENKVECCSIFSSYPIYKNRLIQKIWDRLCYEQYVSKNLLAILKRMNAKSLHVHMAVLHYLKPIANQIKNVELFYTCHSIVSRYFNDTDRRNEKRAAAYLLQNNNLHMIALHQEMKHEIDTLFNISSTEIIRNGVDFNRFRVSISDNVDLRNNLGIGINSFVVGHVGRFSEMKNHIFLIDVFVEILKYRSDAILMLVGDGPEQEKIKNKVIANGIEKSVIFFSHRTDIPELMSIMDVFVFPSTFEGLPVAVVEAQVVGLRCVISDVVNSSCFFSNKAIPVSLSKDAKFWASVILDPNKTGPYVNQIDLYDMNKEIARLEQMYIN